ncbi:hypothetical protein SEA_FRANSOYER_93 [Microbacterium phage Fransoyer]|nr:hypothetical protein SEA_FRANSOYER_93 [Microbacterium phage Fransoyer]
MGKASRSKRERTEPYEREPKRPTHQYLTPKERQEARRRDRKAAERTEGLLAKLAAQTLRGER